VIVRPENSAEIRTRKFTATKLPASGGGGRWASVPLYAHRTFYVEYPVALIYSRLRTHIGLFMQNLALNIG